MEETIDRKKRCEESAPSKDLIVQATQSQSVSRKAKKQKTLAALATDSSIGQIAEPQKEGKFCELTTNDLQIRTVDIGSSVHDSMVNI